MAPPPDVLFVVLDSVRRERTSLYGHRRETTPALDRLAERATVYENAYTPAPWTLPSHCSMFTGRFPSEHGVTNGFTDRDLRLPSSTPTATELLSEEGYRTAGFSSNPWVGQLSGLDRGFEEYVEWNLEVVASGDAEIHARRERLYSAANSLLGHAARQPIFLLKRRFFTTSLVNRATRWFDRTAEGVAPTFTFLNLMEAHSPYYPPASAFDALDLDPPSTLEPRRLNTALLAYTMGRSELDARRERVMEFYDASVRYQDGKFDELLSALERNGDLDETLVVVCADHGKTLGEYDRDADPPHYLRDINTNVPLLVKYPGQKTGSRVDTPVELTSLFELFVHDDVTQLRQAGAADAAALTEEHVPHSGRSAEDADVERWRSLADEGHKLLRDDDGRELFYRREGSLKEPQARDPERREEFATALDARVDALDAGPSRDGRDSEGLSSDVEAQLHDLGYIE